MTIKNLIKNKLVLGIVGAFAVIFIVLLIAYFGAIFILDRMSIREVTPTQMAAAMRKDEFWSTYRTNTLIFSGTVNNIGSQDGRTLVSFKTNDPYHASCEISNSISRLTVGNTYKFAAETYQAKREPAGVLIHNCTII